MDRTETARPKSAEVAQAADKRHWVLVVLLCTAQLMLVLDVTAVTVALPDMSDDLGLSRATLTWVVSGYGLSFGGLMILGGRLADAIGARRMLVIGLLLFIAASMGTGLAHSTPMLIGGRIVQGIGAALLSPAALSLIVTGFRGEDRNRVLGVWSALAAVGSALGNVLGGALTAGPGWRWLFYINVPIGIAVLTGVPVLVRAARPARAHIDIAGALLITGGTGALIFGLVTAGDSGWSSTTVLGSLLGASVAYGLFVLVERNTGNPLLDVRMFTRRPVVIAAFLMLVGTGLMFALFFLGSIYLQHMRGYSALATGLMFLPLALAAGVGAHFGGHFVGRTGPRGVVVVAMLLAASGALWLAGLSPTANPWLMLMPGLVVAGIGIGAVFVAATTTALANVRPEESGLASGVVNTFHEVGGAVGVAVVSTLAAASITARVMSGFTQTFTAAAIVAVVSAAVSALLIPSGKPSVVAGMHGH